MGADRRERLRVVRFVFGHSTSASWLLWCWLSLFLPLRRAGLPLLSTFRPVYRPRCYSCGPRLIYERRYIERQYAERRYGYGGYRRHYGYSPCGYRRHYGYSPCGYRRNYGYPRYGSYRSWSRPYGYGGVGRRWSLPYAEGYERSGYEEAPRPPAPVLNEGDDY